MKKATSIRHKSTSSQSFIQKYLASKHHGDAYVHTLYDPSLIMHSLQHTLQKTTSHLDQLKRQRLTKPSTAQIQPQENQKQSRHSSSFLKNRIKQAGSQPSPKRNSTLLQILLKNVPNEHPLKEKYPELRQRQLLKHSQYDDEKSQMYMSQQTSNNWQSAFQACKVPREQWKKDQIKKLLQSKGLKHPGMFRQSSLILQKHHSQEQSTTKKVEYPGRRSQIVFRISTEAEQPTNFLKPEKKLLPIVVKPYPFSKISMNPSPMGQRKLQKHGLVLNKRIKIQQHNLDTSIDRSSCFGEAVSIEPWGTGQRMIVVEEVHSDWHGIV